MVLSLSSFTPDVPLREFLCRVIHQMLLLPKRHPSLHSGLFFSSLPLIQCGREGGKRGEGEEGSEIFLEVDFLCHSVFACVSASLAYCLRARKPRDRRAGLRENRRRMGLTEKRDDQSSFCVIALLSVAVLPIIFLSPSTRASSPFSADISQLSHLPAGHLLTSHSDQIPSGPRNDFSLSLSLLVISAVGTHFDGVHSCLKRPEEMERASSRVMLSSCPSMQETSRARP